MVDLTPYGIVPDEFTWPAGEIANSQPPPNARFRIRNRELLIQQPVILWMGPFPFPSFVNYRTRPMAEEDILTHPYPDTTRPRGSAYVSP
jgi:hypothetical protein